MKDEESYLLEEEVEDQVENFLSPFMLYASFLRDACCEVLTFARYLWLSYNFLSFVGIF